LTCPDRKELVSLVSNFTIEREGNILDLVEHVNAEEQRFFCGLLGI
jgi:formyltetrahydrofolate hydrolase